MNPPRPAITAPAEMDALSSAAAAAAMAEQAAAAAAAAAAATEAREGAAGPNENNEVGASAATDGVSAEATGPTHGETAALTNSAAGGAPISVAEMASLLLEPPPPRGRPPQDPPPGHRTQGSPPVQPPAAPAHHHPRYAHPTHYHYNPPSNPPYPPPPAAAVATAPTTAPAMADNYYPTYPANTSTLARYDSGIFDTGTSDDDDDEASQEEAEEYEASGTSLLGSSLDGDGSSVGAESHATAEAGSSPVRQTPMGSNEGVKEARPSTAPPSSLFEDQLSALPRTHRPFQSSPGNADDSEAAGHRWETADASYAPSRAVKTHGRGRHEGRHAGEGQGEGSPFSSYTKDLPYEPPQWDIPTSSQSQDHLLHNLRPAATPPPATEHTVAYICTKSYDSEYAQLPPIPLHSLPLDALHSISSYCTPAEWVALGTTNKTHRALTNEILSKVRRHAAKCLLEIGTAWARGEHGDARELAGLYLGRGVGVYPCPGGHGARTVAWRMGLELEAMAPGGAGSSGAGEGDDGTVDGEGNGNGGNERGAAGGNGADENGEEEGRIPTDPWYAHRYGEHARDARDAFARDRWTYVEEKAAFWKKQKGIDIPSPHDDAPFPPGARFPRRYSFAEGNGARGPPPVAGGPLRAAPQAAAAPLGAYGGGAPLARPQTAVPGPRYVRRSSFSGAPGGRSFSLGEGRSSELDRGVSSRSSFRNFSHDTASRTAASRNSFHDSFRAAGEAKSPPSISAAATPPVPTISIRIHRHLADQHLFGSPGVNDENGTMDAAPTSMSADFFHPTWEGRRGLSIAGTVRRDGGGEEASPTAGGTEWGDVEVDAATHTGTGIEAAVIGGGAAMDDIGETVDREAEEALNRGRPGADAAHYRAAVRAFVGWTLANASDRPRRGGAAQRRSLPPGDTAAGRLHALLANPSAWRTRNDAWGGGPLGGARPPAGASPANDVRLEIYSASSAAAPTTDADDATSHAVSAMRARCERYQRRFDALLASSRCDAVAFREALLDFWDELLPATAGVHYWNKQSPVPRMTHLRSFLTAPCPKALKTIQCEIERVKVSSKNKGKKMKGKFFPSYEYRLFIRDTTNDNNPFDAAANAPPRKDTVLLVAKNKGGKHRSVAAERTGSGVGGLEFATPAGVAGPGSRRGVTNYYLCLPAQRDVDGHYKSANRHNATAALRPGESSGLPVSPEAAAASNDRGGAGSVEVGRLQSNFIGTEFQIFVPHARPPSRTAEPPAERTPLDASSSEGRMEGDRRVHPLDAAVPAAVVNANAPRRSVGRRGSGLARLARRASGRLSRRASRRNSEEPLEDPGSEERPKRRGSSKVMRRMSWGNMTGGNATNRRAVANGSDPLDAALLASSSHSGASHAMGEVENGAITYTANLLGNRPRIMDVCIPRLLDDGRVSDEWNGERNGGGGHFGGGGGATASMLDLFKTIQQGMETLEDDAGRPNNAAAAAADAHDLMILQNRPPWWNVELGAFVLNFGGRVKVASVKNFQLCERNDRDHIMQFGRIEGRHAFTMDFGWPLTPMQAFAIAISSLQSKISFG